MTSSLVGSEMCIRDRARPSYSDGFADMLLFVDSNGEAYFLLDGRCTVSYTHLTLPTICSV
eukprot:2989904-Prorocentrum_lima.AAC.1